MKKAYEIYKSFEDWIIAHKHSRDSISTELEHCLQTYDNRIDALQSYIKGLKAVRAEIVSEITEAEEWVKYFKRKG
jgi:hypothetical protein